MIQLPDFKEKQIVFIGFNADEKPNTLKVKNENLVVYNKEGELLNQISCTKLFAVFVMGTCTITSNLIKKLADYGVSLFLLNKGSFKSYSQILSATKGNYILRQNQYLFKDDLGFSKNLLVNKIANQMDLLKEIRPNFYNNVSKINQLKLIKQKISKAESIEQLMGIEGAFNKKYLREIFGDFNFKKRLPRTKFDEINVLLDIGYTMIFNVVDCLLSLHGFDTYKGIYHQLYFQRQSLTCDLVEPLRVLIDKSLYKAFKLKQFDLKDFCKKGDGYALRLDKQSKYLKLFGEAILKRKEDVFTYVKKHYFQVLHANNSYSYFKY